MKYPSKTVYTIFRLSRSLRNRCTDRPITVCEKPIKSMLVQSRCDVVCVCVRERERERERGERERGWEENGKERKKKTRERGRK